MSVWLALSISLCVCVGKCKEVFFMDKSVPITRCQLISPRVAGIVFHGRVRQLSTTAGSRSRRASQAHRARYVSSIAVESCVAGDARADMTIFNTNRTSHRTGFSRRSIELNVIRLRQKRFEPFLFLIPTADAAVIVVVCCRCRR